MRVVPAIRNASKPQGLSNPIPVCNQAAIQGVAAERVAVIFFGSQLIMKFNLIN